MPTQFVPGEDDHSAVMSCIGHICLQWARLESTLLAICAVLARMGPEEAFIAFGNLDMRPRMNMAINLARHHKMHPPLLKRLIALRDSMSKQKLDDKRNQAVHGVHNTSEIPHHVQLMMVRWSGDRRNQDVSVADLHNTGMLIHELGNECWLIFNAHIARTGFPHLPENSLSDFVEADPGAWFKIKQYIRTRINHLRGNL